jgi:hypothetical protein
MKLSDHRGSGNCTKARIALRRREIAPVPRQARIEA